MSKSDIDPETKKSLALQALELWQTPNRDGSLPHLSDVCAKVGVSLGVVEYVCASDKEVKAARTRARKARAAKSRQDYDDILQSLIKKGKAGETTSAKAAITALQWILQRDDPEAYADPATTSVSVSIAQQLTTLDFSRFSDGALTEFVQQIEAQLGRPALEASPLAIEAEKRGVNQG